MELYLSESKPGYSPNGGRLRSLPTGHCTRDVGLTAKVKVDGDGRLHFGGFTVEDIGLVTPITHRIERARAEHLRTADDLKLIDGALLRDDGVEHNRT